MWRDFINLFFPKICPGCLDYLQTNEQVICTECRHNIPLTQHHLYLQNEAFKKFYGKVDIEHASAFLAFHKKGIVQQLIHHLKYKNQQNIGTVLGKWYAEELLQSLTVIPFEIIVPVPLHPKKFKERGYNQVTTFGNAIAHCLQIEFRDDILYRTKYAKSQSKKNLKDRAENVLNSFEAKLNPAYYNKHFVLIDDVLTTGATLEACSLALQKIPGAKISILCMAMTTDN